MKVSTLLGFAIAPFGYCSAKGKGSSDSNHGVSSAKNQGDKLFAKKVWQPKNFGAFLIERRLEFDASFMKLGKEALDSKISSFWDEVIDRYAFGGVDGINLLKAMRKNKFERRVQKVIDSVGVKHNQIGTKGEQAVNDILKSIPHQGQSTQVIAEYLVATNGRDVDYLLGRVMAYISKQLIMKEYDELIQLAKWSQQKYSILPEKIYERAMDEIAKNAPPKRELVGHKRQK